MAQISADEISKLIREQIENYDKAVEVNEVGSIISLGDGIARLHGLEKVMAGEMLQFPHDVAGIAMNLEEDQVGAVLLGEYSELKEGDEVRRTGRIISVPVGPALIGRGSSTPLRTSRKRMLVRSVTSMSPLGRNARSHGRSSPFVTVTRTWPRSAVSMTNGPSGNGRSGTPGTWAARNWGTRQSARAARRVRMSTMRDSEMDGRGGRVGAGLIVADPMAAGIRYPGSTARSGGRRSSLPRSAARSMP
jgi:hypothetical protein